MLCNLSGEEVRGGGGDRGTSSAEASGACSAVPASLCESHFLRESVGGAGQRNPVAPVIPASAIARVWLGASLRRAPLLVSLSAGRLPLGGACPAIPWPAPAPRPPHVTIFTLLKTAPGPCVVLHRAGQGLAFTGRFGVPAPRTWGSGGTGQVSSTHQGIELVGRSRTVRAGGFSSEPDGHGCPPVYSLDSKPEHLAEAGGILR